MRAWTGHDTATLAKVLKIESLEVEARDGQDLLILCGKDNVPEKLNVTMNVLLEHPTCSHPPVQCIASIQDRDLCEICVKRKRYSTVEH